MVQCEGVVSSSGTGDTEEETSLVAAVEAPEAPVALAAEAAFDERSVLHTCNSAKQRTKRQLDSRGRIDSDGECEGG